MVSELASERIPFTDRIFSMQLIDVLPENCVQVLIFLLFYIVLHSLLNWQNDDP